MSKKRETFWEKRASHKMIFVCFLLIIATFICFTGTYLQFKDRGIKAPDEIWKDNNSSYDEKVEQQIQAEQRLREERKGALTE
ncbi:hypothetical protein J6X15_00835 [Candidatus Saccharibacteria bacterium]|nr:hypothetical protein [Candidatus Saccharibacteria bacterium]